MFDRFEHWRRVRHSYPQQWQEACETNESVMYLTAAELGELESEIRALLMRYNERLVDPALRPSDARAVEVIAAAYLVHLGRVGEEPADPAPGQRGQS